MFAISLFVRDANIKYKSIYGCWGVIKNFRIYVKMNKKGPEDENYLIDHSSLIFLLDENDNFLKFFRPKDFSLNSIDWF